jgi:hypothetical protein
MSPRGLFTARVILGWGCVRTIFPLTVTLSTPGVTLVPSTAIRPFTHTSPCAISASADLREQIPASAMNFCSRVLPSADSLWSV